MTVELRAATPEDASAIARVCLLAGGGAFEYLYDGLQPGIDAEFVLSGLAALNTNPQSYRRFTLAESEGTIIGGVNAMSVSELIDADHAILPALHSDLGLRPWPVIRSSLRRVRLSFRMRGKQPEPDSLILVNIAVFPDHAGQGIGAKLVQHVLDRAANEGFPSVSLVVWKSNERARTLYERMGFALVDTAAFKPLRHMPYRARCLMVRELS